MSKPHAPYQMPVNEQGETKAEYEARRSREAQAIIDRHQPVMSEEGEAALVAEMKAAGFSFERLDTTEQPTVQ